MWRFRAPHFSFLCRSTFYYVARAKNKNLRYVYLGGSRQEMMRERQCSLFVDVLGLQALRTTAVRTREGNKSKWEARALEGGWGSSVSVLAPDALRACFGSACVFRFVCVFWGCCSISRGRRARPRLPIRGRVDSNTILGRILTSHNAGFGIFGSSRIDGKSGSLGEGELSRRDLELSSNVQPSLAVSLACFTLMAAVSRSSGLL